MKDVTIITPLTKLTIDELKGCFGGTDVLAGVLDPAGGVVSEDVFI